MNLVRYGREGGVGWIELNRPERLNTMTREFLEDALVAFRSAVEDEAANVLVLTGAGRAFCAGGDLSEMSGGGGFGTATPELESQRLRRYMETSRLLHETPKVTIAAINGACAGAGLSWACAADLRFAAENARFNTAFLGAGLSGDFGGSWLLPRIIGAGRAREKYLLPGPFDASEAFRIGLVSGIFPRDELIGEVTRTAQRLARSAPIARQLIKQNLLDQEEITFSRALDLEASRHGYCCTTKDFHEAAAAYLAKREPVFHGS